MPNAEGRVNKHASVCARILNIAGESVHLRLTRVEGGNFLEQIAQQRGFPAKRHLHLAFYAEAIGDIHTVQNL